MVEADPSAPTSAVAPLRADPGRSALLFDFDGTLSPIVDDPDAAGPAAGVVGLLEELAGRYRTVGAVSGRPVAFLAARLPSSLVLSGLYGLESVVDGVRADRSGVEVWRHPVAEAAALAVGRGPEGMRVEPKGLSVTLHYRARPDLGGPVLHLAEALAAETGLEARAAKMSVELHPPVDADKGLVVRELAVGAAAVLYAGDDLGDLPAFAALAELRADGRATVAVAVETPELPASLRAAADLLVDGTQGVVGLLHALLVP